MKDKNDNSIIKIIKAEDEQKAVPNPLPVYPPGDDIYNKNKNEENTDPENILEDKIPNSSHNSNNEKDFDDDVSGEDLDIPGAELDDENEAIGNEDEENNYYSIGGDNHNNLDENKDE